MRVGVYVDGFNLYYGARSVCGQGTAGWRWLDLRALGQYLLANNQRWKGSQIARVVFCTARIDVNFNRSGFRDQADYLKALEHSGSADLIEYGRFAKRIKAAPLANKHKPRGPIEVPTPVAVPPGWPVVAKTPTAPVTRLHATFQTWEEKGSDVNVASHLLIDILDQSVDAAIVVSNDSDLKLPVRHARNHVPVGLINPGQGYLAGDLRGAPGDGVGGHWWYTLTHSDLQACQLPNPVGAIAKPAGW